MALVIPNFERPESLLETLSSVSQIDYPKSRWQVIVVDDGSSPKTIGYVCDWIQTAGTPVRLLQQEHRGPAAARNAGARAASARVLIFIDNDITVAPDFVRRHLQTLDAQPGCWVIGRSILPPHVRRTPFGRYRDDQWEAFHSAHGAPGVSETTGMTAQNLSLQAKDFEALGGFDEEFSIASCEDWELGLRARASGIRIVYDPGIVVVHNDWAITLHQFCERQRLYSESDVLLWRKYGAASPRAHLVRENLPVRWDDPVRLVLKKAVKAVLSTDLGIGLVRAACALLERAAPNASWIYRAYSLAVALSIFRGVRHGIARYGESPGSKHAMHKNSTVV